MENEEILDSPFNFYQNNLPPKDYSNKKNNALTYSEIFNSRNYFSILGLSPNNIIISKQSLIKIASMIEVFPEDYIYLLQIIMILKLLVCIYFKSIIII